MTKEQETADEDAGCVKIAAYDDVLEAIAYILDVCEAAAKRLGAEYVQCVEPGFRAAREQLGAGDVDLVQECAGELCEIGADTTDGAHEVSERVGEMYWDVYRSFIDLSSAVSWCKSKSDWYLIGWTVDDIHKHLVNAAGNAADNRARGEKKMAFYYWKTCRDSAEKQALEVVETMRRKYKIWSRVARSALTLRRTTTASRTGLGTRE